MKWGKPDERRLGRRYKIGLVIQVRDCTDSRGTARWQTGRTCDMSTLGVSFRCGQTLPMDAGIEMIIDWPAKQDNLHPIYLRVAGHVVRSAGRKTAVRISYCRMVVEKGNSAPMAAAASSGG